MNRTRKTTMGKMAVMMSALAMVGCGKPSLHLTGEIANMEDGKIYAAVLDSSLQSLEFIDTLEVKGGKLEHRGISLVDPECILLFFDDPNSGRQGTRSMTLFVGNEDVKIVGDVNKPEEFVVTGSEYNHLVENYQDSIPGVAQLDSLYRVLQGIENDQDLRDEVKGQMMQIQVEQKEFIDKMINANINNPVGAFLLCNNLYMYSFDQVDEMTSQMEKWMPKHKYVAGLRNQIELARPEHDAIQRVQIGRQAPDFELPNINGEQVKLSDLRGKVVLIDFWASWCAPCRRNNEGLVETYKKFSQKGLEIVSVSVDTQVDEWKKAVKEDGLLGTLLIDSVNLVASTYCVKTIPCAFLIDPDGEIVSRDSQVEDLFADIERMLK
ncbi:MAG: AhpC/TSA family protein [Bacteroidales bacterium]|nr:AhpC/TSA family protein [Bacteroidales bacterium]